MTTLLSKLCKMTSSKTSNLEGSLGILGNKCGHCSCPCPRVCCHGNDTFGLPLLVCWFCLWITLDTIVFATDDWPQSHQADQTCGLQRPCNRNSFAQKKHLGPPTELGFKVTWQNSLLEEVYPQPKARSLWDWLRKRWVRKLEHNLFIVSKYDPGLMLLDKRTC